MSLQGQAEQPMVLRGRSVSSMVPDAPVPWPWTRAAGRVWFAAGRLGSKRSRTSAQLCSMLPGGHRGMAVWPSQVQCSMILTLVDRRSHLCGRVQAVGAISGRRRTWSFRPIWRGPGAGRVPRPCTLHTLKTANPARQRPSAASRRLPLPCNGHTGMPRCPPGQHAA